MMLQQQLQQAFQLFQGGQVQRALDILGPLAISNPKTVDVQHLLALAHKALGNFEAAENAFRTALELAPDNHQILNNYANFLSGIGNFAAAINIFNMIINSSPNNSAAWLGLGLAALSANKNEDAEIAFKKVISLEKSNPTAWHGLGSAQRALGKLAKAVEAFEETLKIAPNNGAVWINLGVIKRLQGDNEAAETCFDAAQKTGFEGPELLDGRASILLDCGKTEEGIKLYHEICQTYPDYVPGHEALAKALYQTSPDINPNEAIRIAANNQPENVGLQMGFLKFLSEQKKWDEYLERVEKFKQNLPEPIVLFSKAVGLDGLDRLDEARPFFEKSVQMMPDNENLQVAYMRFLLRDKNPELMASVAEEFVKQFPNDQTAWGYLGLAWRLLDDPREDWLHRYDEFIQPLQIDIPDGFKSEEDFAHALEQTLLPLHQAKKEPVDQSVRTGTQTSTNLFGNPEGNIKLVSEAILKAIIEYQRHLPDDETHPFLGRKSDLLRFIGSWSVRLRQSGFHISHIHGEGWLSSAFYVVLPPSVKEGQKDKQGWIQFGCPQEDLGIDIEPRRFIQPKVGCLAVFPSYTWHGTIPFDDDSPRMTMAYDVVPK
jgi:Tfp pilus assembly protein PilF